MKRFLSFLIIFCMLLIMAGCNSNESVTSQDLSSEAFSSESLEVTSEETETSEIKTEDTQEKTSTSSYKASSSEKNHSNSSKNNTLVTTSSNVSSKNNYKQATDSDKNVTVDASGIVSITIPKWFLLKMEPDYDYKLTDTEANTYKFISVTKNPDGSATFKIGYNDYHRFLLIFKSSVNAVVNKYKHNIWFSKIESDAGYNNIKIYTKYNSLEDFDDDFGVYIALSGIETTYYQYLHYNYSVGTTITVYNKDNVVLESYKFPDLLK